MNGGMEMFNHIQTDNNGVVIGTSMLLQEKVGIDNLYYISDIDSLPKGFTFGWRRVGDEWLPPPLPTEYETLTAEQSEITARLRQIWQDEQFAAFLGEDITEQTPIQTMDSYGTGLRGLPPAMTEKERLLARRAEIKARLAELGNTV